MTRDLVRNAARRARWTPERLQVLLFRLGLVCLAVSGLHVAWWVWTGESLEGSLSVRRPILFFFAGGLLSITLGWTLVELRKGARPVSERLIRLLAVAFVAGLPGLSMIGLQYWRQAETHFHPTTSADQVAQALVLSSALAYSFVAIAVTGALWSRRGGRDLLGLSLRVGWSIHLVATVGVGYALGANEGSPGPRLDALMRMHALGAHSIQLLPLLAWLLSLRPQLADARARELIRLAAGASALWLAGFGFLAWTETPLPEAPVGVLLVLAASVLAGVFLGREALRDGLWKEPAREVWRSFVATARGPRGILADDPAKERAWNSSRPPTSASRT